MDSLNAFVSGRGFFGFLGLDLSDVLGYWVWSGVGLLRFLVSECGFLGYLGLDFQNVLDFCFSAFSVFVLGSGLGFVGLGF